MRFLDEGRKPCSSIVRYRVQARLYSVLCVVSGVLLFMAFHSKIVGTDSVRYTWIIQGVSLLLQGLMLLLLSLRPKDKLYDWFRIAGWCGIIFPGTIIVAWFFDSSLRSGILYVLPGLLVSAVALFGGDCLFGEDLPEDVRRPKTMPDTAAVLKSGHGLIWSDEAEHGGSAEEHGYVPYRRRARQFSFVMFGMAALALGMGVWFLWMGHGDFSGGNRAVSLLAVSLVVQAVFIAISGYWYFKISGFLSEGCLSGLKASCWLSAGVGLVCLLLLVVLLDGDEKAFCMAGLFGFFPLLWVGQVNQWILKR
ncbi:hypothetical protein OZX62_07430 [Bifidobacterium sp. ESL0690]|uniref:hypothetical protein n=1 Tax=Bifidobacterium sp. ESL0690 TaxID=2983214 RepID=UPI0023F77856|nr:hypothetical protein [Bifidobacterium sp. ESL0690]WEV46269.1 hypothetical protein OZX62_07430 [Bifidobacterium sp. ESL0690]